MSAVTELQQSNGVKCKEAMSASIKLQQCNVWIIRIARKQAVTFRSAMP
jgi:hypothetical protein